MASYDAGLEREALARELAEWQAAGFISGAKAERWNRRVRILAKRTGFLAAAVTNDLLADAGRIRAGEEIS